MVHPNGGGPDTRMFHPRFRKHPNWVRRCHPIAWLAQQLDLQVSPSAMSSSPNPLTSRRHEVVVSVPQIFEESPRPAIARATIRNLTHKNAAAAK
jgi:hypothetical protein